MVDKVVVLLIFVFDCYDIYVVVSWVCGEIVLVVDCFWIDVEMWVNEYVVSEFGLEDCCGWFVDWFKVVYVKEMMFDIF